MIMTKTPQSSSFGYRNTAFLLAMVFLMFLTFSTAGAVQGSRSRLLGDKIMRQELMAAQGGAANTVRNSLNTISVSGGGGTKSNVESQPAVCSQRQRIRHYCPPFPALPPPTPPSSSDYEIDPRYGVEKRLVPSGPNPLHN